MRVNRDLLGWGVFFIVLGLVPLAVRSGAVDESLVARAWQLWPLILIGIGIGLVLSRTPAAVLGRLVVAVTAGVMLGGLLATGIGGVSNGLGACGAGVGGGSRTPFPDQRGSFGTTARVSIELDCGSVDVSSAPGAGWTLSGTSPEGVAPVVSEASDRLEVRPAKRGSTGTLGTPAGVDWTATLPQDPRTRLELTVNAGSARAALAGMHLDGVAASVNAGSAVLDLSGTSDPGTIDASVNAGSLSLSLPASNVTGSLSANAGSLQVCVPSGVDLRIRLQDSALGSNNFRESGLREQGGTWETAGFGSGAAQIDLSASANLGSITLNPGPGCE